MSIQIAVFPGDGAAATAVDATVRLLKRLGTLSAVDLNPVVEVHRPDGDEDVLESGGVPERYLTACEEADTVLFGACHDRHTPLLRYLRYEYGGGMAANLRPVKYFDGVQTPLSDPSGTDLLIIRENLEGLYYRAEGDLSTLSEALPGMTGAGGRRLSELGEGAYAVRVASEAHTRRFAELACRLAGRRFSKRPLKVTAASKSNVLPETAGLFDNCVKTAVEEQAGLSYKHLHADDVAQRLVMAPDQFDVVITPNYAGDILSDGAAGVAGGLGVAPSGCFAADGTAYFEPVHGAAPDIAGSGTINPTATMLSSVMLLEHKGYQVAANRLRAAIESVYKAGGPLTPDQGGTAGTDDFTDAVADRLS
jgi:isocitrate/isopropylmalate dehydrogenase